MADVVGIHRIEDALDALVHEIIGILAKLLGFSTPSPPIMNGTLAQPESTLN
jgi:hypothetical protein